MSGSPTAALLFQKCANTSTILTHLNRVSSYLVHDVYYRFIKKDGTEAQYVNAGRLSTVGLYVFAARLSLTMSSAQQAFQILLSIGAGTGMLYMARWFWRRVSACRRVGVSACRRVGVVRDRGDGDVAAHDRLRAAARHAAALVGQHGVAGA